MSRKRLVALGAFGCAALAAAGAGYASHRRTQETRPAAASFAATSISNSRSSSCTASDGVYQETTATYTGTASSSDPRLSGPLTIRAHSMLDTSTGLGWVEGSLRIRGSSGSAKGTLHAALGGGNAVGALVGSAERPQAKLVASLSSAFSPTGGFSSGALGSGSANGAGVLFARGTCTNVKRTRFVAVSQLSLRPRAVVPPASGKGAGAGSFTLDLTRDSTGAITSANAVFYVNYRFGRSVTITGLALHQGARGTSGPVVLDSGIGSFTDADGSGNLTRTVTSVSGSLAQALLANPRGYYVELTTSDSALRSQLGGFRRR
jgi:hypothetical protein